MGECWFTPGHLELQAEFHMKEKLGSKRPDVWINLLLFCEEMGVTGVNELCFE